MDLEPATRAKVLLSGASGMLGKALAEALHRRGEETFALVRHPAQKQSGTQATPSQTAGLPAELVWDPEHGDLDLAQLQALGPLSAAIHLSGANVSSRRWTAAYKREIWESRVTTTHVLATALAQLQRPPAALIVASAVGLYGDRGDEPLDENSAPGTGYFPDLCLAWEAAAKPALTAGIRVVHLRFGVVIGRDGGIMARLAPMFRLGLGGPLGTGHQWMSWVSESDVVAAALFALDRPPLSGAFNVTAPNPVTNAQFTRELAHAVHRPAFLAAPAFALRLAFGQMADEALLASTRAFPKRLDEAGFRFAHPTISGAIADALRKL